MPDDVEFPISCGAFVATLKGGPDEVWSMWLKQNRGHENHKPSEWRQLLDLERNKPAHPSVLNR